MHPAQSTDRPAAGPPRRRKPKKRFWVCTELLECTTQTGPFPSRYAAWRHRHRCYGGTCGGPNSYTVKAVESPWTATTADAATHLLRVHKWHPRLQRMQRQLHSLRSV